MKPFFFSPRNSQPEPTALACLQVGKDVIPLLLIRNPRARRYVLRLAPDGSIRVTVPRGGSFAEADAFARRQSGWIEQQLEKRAAQSYVPIIWRPGQEIFFRGEQVTITACQASGRICFGDQELGATQLEGDLRPLIERRLYRMASVELPARTLELAARCELPVQRVVVRNQRSRWGSCSIKRTISLNWRLIQTPDWVRDYIIIHELMHLREMNHSPRFWRCVSEVDPNFRVAERWLKDKAPLLR
ncbi:MAG: M48 family metallopeptidase [Verrucomicrobia bacterium]|nr:M48 family metallopeptidase [Verrucomicrobiota bacterium]